MPWKETDAMKEKRAFIDEMLKQNKPFRELCREYGVSEKTRYKWRKRFYELRKNLIETRKMIQAFWFTTLLN